MPEIKLTVTANQWTRIKAAFMTRGNVTGKDTVPTDKSMREWVLGQIKDRVQRYELGQASAVAEKTKRAELEAEGW